MKKGIFTVTLVTVAGFFLSPAESTAELSVAAFSNRDERTSKSSFHGSGLMITKIDLKNMHSMRGFENNGLTTAQLGDPSNDRRLLAMKPSAGFEMSMRRSLFERTDGKTMVSKANLLQLESKTGFRVDKIMSLGPLRFSPDVLTTLIFVSAASVVVLAQEF
ncbi:hypothetical protein IIA15_02880 [candidate division TA06 bacterium]|nr:hypothetical protein [candidate division TA06 bacterium]